MNGGDRAGIRCKFIDLLVLYSSHILDNEMAIQLVETELSTVLARIATQ